MSDQLKTDGNKGFPPGVCFPWDEKVKDFGTLTGDEAMIRKEWESLDAFAYLYLWYWVHR